MGREGESNGMRAESLRVRLARLLRASLAAGCYAVLLGSAVGLLTGSTCTVRVCDDDDFDDDINDVDDDDCDDDDDAFEGAREGPGADDPYRLRSYRIVPGTEPWRPPVRSIEDIEGLSLLAVHGLRPHGPEDLRIFSARVLLANGDLLGIPVSSGWHRFREVEFVETDGTSAFVVTCDQERAGDRGAVVKVVGGEIRFVFDAAGTLLRIENRSLLLGEGGVPASRR